MKKNLSKILLAFQMLASVIVAGAIYQWAPVCDGLLELANGNMVHMKCFYTGQASVVLSIILFITAIAAYLSKNDQRKVQWIVLLIGVMLIVNTFDSAIGIGICKKTSMACHATAAWIRAGGVIAIISSLLGIGINNNPD